VTVTGVEDRAGNGIREAAGAFKYVRPDRPLVELHFDEARGRTAVNTGVSQRLAAKALLTEERPSRSANTPPGGGSHSLDFGRKAGEYAVDLPEAIAEELEALASFTITAWVNCTSDKEGAGGNRIVHMADTLGTKAGIDLVVTRDGRLKLGVNEWPDTTRAVSSAGRLPVDRNAGKDNWRFVAVTYDSTADKNQVRFYVGSPGKEMSLDKAVTYDHGPVGKGTGRLTIGHFNPGVRRNHRDRMLRGLIDEVRIFGSKTDGTGALSIEQVRALQGNGD
jgi:hypothetical protein